MRIYIFSAFLLFFLPIFGESQETSGTIIYDVKVNMHMQLTGDRERFKEFIPEYRTTPYELIFNEEQSVYRMYEDPNEVVNSRGRGGFRMRFMGAGSTVFRDFEDNSKVEQREFMGKNFVITGNLDQRGWKVTGEAAQIAGYPCLKAEMQDTTNDRTLTAWFTPQVGVPTGPDTYAQLPGLVLQVESDDNSLTITPRDIKWGEVNEKALDAPGKGKEVTDEEYRDIVRQAMQNMRSQRGDRGSRG
jgi:GLPGLI family protein